MRYLCLIGIILCLCGCSKKDQQIVVAVIEPTDYTPFLAWFASSESTPTPAPDNNVIVVGSVCPSCNGSGKNNTDGTMVKTCKDCKGDGRVDEGDPILGVTHLPTLRTYYIEYKGHIYVWNGSEFSCEGQQPITPQEPLDIRRVKSLQLCQGTHCLVIPIQMK